MFVLLSGFADKYRALLLKDKQKIKKSQEIFEILSLDGPFYAH